MYIVVQESSVLVFRHFCQSVGCLLVVYLAVDVDIRARRQAFAEVGF